MAKRIKLPIEEERERKSKMAVRLSILFLFINFALLGVIIYEILQII